MYSFGELDDPGQQSEQEAVDSLFYALSKVKGPAKNWLTGVTPMHYANGTTILMVGINPSCARCMFTFIPQSWNGYPVMMEVGENVAQVRKNASTGCEFPRMSYGPSPLV